MTVATMRNNILRYCPMSPDIITSTIQDAYRQLMMMEWNRLNAVREFTTATPVSTGKITVDPVGNVTGFGTLFNSAMVGRNLRVYYSDSYFKIASFTSSTSITLQDWAGLSIVTHSSYSIFSTIYTVPATMKMVFRVAYQTSLEKKTQDFFNRRDPGRTTTGSPTWWAFAEWNALGYPSIEIYPVPDQGYPIRVYGKLGYSPLADSDTPYLSEDLIEARALLDCYRIKHSMNPKEGWDTRITEQQPFLSTLMTVAQDEDYQIGASRDKVKDYLETFENYPPSDSFWTSHDVE